jgi:F420-non-reducing hydrogenase iron-sulfur subunit
VIEETREILSLLGIDERRLRLKWISASEGAAFAEEIRDFVQTLKALGENPLKENVNASSDFQQIIGT